MTVESSSTRQDATRSSESGEFTLGTRPYTTHISSAEGTSSTSITTISVAGSVAGSVAAVCVLLVCVLVAVLVLWRYYKHKTNSHTPPAIYEETGQVCYSTAQHKNKDTDIKTRDTACEDDEEIATGEYSVLSYGKCRKEGPLAESDTPSSVFYSSLGVEGQKKADQEKRRAEEALHTSETATPADQLYAQVDKKRKITGASSDPHTSEAGPSVDQLYAQVDKKKVPPAEQQFYAQVDKKKKKSGPHSSETNSATAQLYAQVDKKKVYDSYVCKVSS